MACTLAGIELPFDIRWVDEFQWQPVASQLEVTCGGSLLVEESQQLAGMPITLQSGIDERGKHYAWATRETVAALHALASTAYTAPLALQLLDGRTFNVRFRHADRAFEANPVEFLAPQIDSDRYHLTLRLYQV